jgi:hypothetical protein
LRFSIAGALAIGVYLLTALVSFKTGLVRVRPLYEGNVAPPPYRWVNPPPDFVAGNKKPAGTSGSVTLRKTGSVGFSVGTPDQQSVVILPDGAFAPKAGQTTVKITIAPLDPATIGAPPAGMHYDGNAYDIRAFYEPSGAPAQPNATTCPAATSGLPTKCITVVLVYPINANTLQRRDGATWVVVPAQPAAQQLYGDSSRTGVFVAVGPGAVGTVPTSTVAPTFTPAPRASKKGDFIAIGLGVAAVLVGVVLGRMRATRTRARRAKGRKAPAGKAAPPRKKRR